MPLPKKRQRRAAAAIRRMLNARPRRARSAAARMNGNGKSRTAERALAQGVAMAPRGGILTPSLRASPILGLDATHPMHLPLPRAVGPYTVLKTTQLVQTSSQIAFFGTFMSEAMTNAQDQWIAMCGMGEAIAGPIQGTGATFAYPMVGMDSFEYAATVAPAAVTIQIMNPEALQTTHGIAYIGRSTAQYELGGSLRTWATLGNEFVQFMAPRLCSAGKLALRGVKVSSYPLDMNELSDFRGVRPYADAFGAGGGTKTFNWASQKIRPAGFAPLVINNPDGIGLQVLVTIEWRVRFDPGNVAAGTHRQYPIATDATWSKVTSAMSSAGHGVVDIAERTAEVGEAAAAAAGIAAMF